MSVRITVEGMDVAADALAGMADFERSEFLDGLGALITRQTQRRIRSEKTAPDGAAWQPNIEGTSTLFKSGQLDDSIHHEAGSSNVEVGSNKVYARIHQEGGVIEPKSANALAFTVGGAFVLAKRVTMPQRQYLGLSADNRNEIESFAEDFLGEDFGEAD